MRGSTDWLPRTDPDLVEALDDFIGEIVAAGGRAFISPNSEALGREAGNEASQHYYAPGRPVRAADVMVQGVTLQQAVEIAKRMRRFSGIGAYNDTRPAPMVHLDVRPDRSPDNPALWSRVAGTYGAIEQAFV